MSNKKKENRLFHVGKGVKTDNRLTPLRGEPNTNLDTYAKEDGKIRNRKKYGRDGSAVKDLSVGHFVHHKNDHAHDYMGSARSGPRDLTFKEQRELNKAKRKRRTWK